MSAARAAPRWRFLMKPWRYDFEYARAWRGLRFPLIGISTDGNAQLRMGGKGRGGRIPPRPFRYLPPGLWTELNQLGVLAKGDEWDVHIDSRIPAAELPPGLLEQQCRHYAEHGPRRSHSIREAPRMRAAEVFVDEVPTRFEGCQIDGVWVGSTVLPDVSISVTAFDVDPEALSLVTITDPSAYLKGQRDFMRR